MEIRFNDVPRNWAVCFNGECPLKSECMRFLAGETMPDSVMTWRTIMPAAWKQGDCKAFVRKRVERKAYGLKRFLDHVEKVDYKRLREDMMGYLGGRSSYYRYSKGEKLLSETQQRDLLQMMKEAGYEGKGEFEHYCDVLVFDRIVPKNGAPF